MSGATQRKSILLVVPVYASYHCFLRELAEALVEQGRKVAVACDLSVTMGQEQDRELEAIQFFHLSFPRGANPLAHLKAAARLRKIIQKARPDLVHAHFSAAIVTTALAVGGRNSPLAIGTFQGLQFPLASGIKRWIFQIAEVFASKRLHGVWVLTKDDLAALRAAGVARAHLQKGFGFGCRTDRFDPGRFSEEERAKLRKKLGIEPGQPIYTYVGRKVAFKGFHLVIRAFWQVSRFAPDARLLIVGDRDPIHPTGLTVEEEAKLDRTPAIIQCGWQQDVAPYLAIATALVHPSTREGMPVGCMEALAMGIPLIAPDGRGMRELLSLAKEKPLPAVTEEALAAAMRQILDQPSKVNSERWHASERLLLDRKNYVREQRAIFEATLTGAGRGCGGEREDGV